jgi:hypothetical protein
MRIGMLAAALVVMAAPSLSLAADPAIVYQTQPLGRLLDDFRAVVQSVGGDEPVKEINKEIERTLGKQGFNGFDLNQPIVGYLDIPADPSGAVAVICFPVTTEKDWLDFCERWTKSKPKALKDGLFEVPGPKPGVKAAMKIVNGYAYIAAGAKDPERVLDAKTIVPFAKIYDAADVSLLVGRIYFDRLPKELRGMAKQGLAQAKAPGIGAQEMLILGPFVGLADRLLDLTDGAKDAALRVNVDVMSGEASAELTLTPISGSALEKTAAAMKPGLNRFAGIIGADAAAGIRLRLPLDVPSVQKSTVAMLEELQKQANNNAFPPMKAMVDELLKGFIRTVKTGEMDGAAVLRGPSKDGTFTACAALSFDDPSAFEKELKKAIDANAPPDFKDALKWDAEKVNGVSIHTIDISKMPGGERELKAVFGQNMMFAFSFAPKAAYAAIGPGAEPVAAIKAAMAVKPVEAPALDLAYNGPKLLKLIDAVEPQAVQTATKMLGKQDKMTTLLGISATGGKDLKVKLAFNLKVFGSMMGFRASASFQPVNPPPVEK